jgi:hypothetical protein
MRKVLALLLVCLLVSPSSPTQEQSAIKARPVNVKAARSAATAVEPVESDESNAGGKLPVRRVVLYKNGVGYFEHLGRVRGSQDVHIDFTSAQLNDVLKSLTVLDLAGGRITGVDYNSEAPLARRLATLRLALGEKPSVSEFLGALRGARLEVRGAGGLALSGKLLSVERKTHFSTNGSTQTDEISLVTDGGEVRTAEITPATSVRIAEKEMQVEVGRYLSLIASSRDQDLRRMTISTAGNGDRNLYVSYISEVPLWKTTYRIVLPTKAEKKPLLQGWAIVDNTVGEDWNDVELSLVAGAPHSFIQELSQAYYGRRPVVGLPESVELTPQTHSATLEPGTSQLNGEVTDATGSAVASANVKVIDQDGQLVAQTATDEDGQYTFDGVPVGNYRIEIDGQGFSKLAMAVETHSGTNTFNGQLNVASSSETVEVTATPVNGRNSQQFGRGVGVGSGGGASSLVHVPLLVPKAGLTLNESIGIAGKADRFSRADIYTQTAGQDAAAKGGELGDLFEYKLKERVTIRKNQSALVPILQTDINAERVSLWSESLGMARPLRALWVNNASALTLDGGSFSVLDDSTFAGEGLVDAIKPGERRLLSYATDLGLLVDSKSESQAQQVTRVRISRGVMTSTSEMHEKKTYTVRNEDTAARLLVIEHPARPEYKLDENGPKPEEKASGLYRFRLSIEPKKTEKLVVNETRPLYTAFSLGSVSNDQIDLFLRQKTINAEIEKSLRRIVEKKNEVAGLNAQAQSQQKAIDQIFTDQGRLRENMKALKGSAEEKALLQRYTRQLDDEETQIDGLRKTMKETESRKDQANTELAKMITELDLDVAL